MSKVSREAQLVALIHFPAGQFSSVSFGKERYIRLPDQHLRGLAELTAAGMLQKKVTFEGWDYTATEAMGVPLRDFERMNVKETYEI